MRPRRKPVEPGLRDNPPQETLTVVRLNKPVELPSQFTLALFGK